MNNSIDFVITWVDGNDLKWQKEKEKYIVNNTLNKNNVRFREWDNLQYWFRGVEKYAPWVRKIHFVTWGHVPKWLNINHPKLNIVKHSDYIPQNYLPTFNSRCIELNLHRIEGLANNFVYFNDDMFIIDEVKPTDFFINNLPCDSAILNVQTNLRYSNQNVITNNMEIINDYYSKNNVLKNNILKYFYPLYGINLFRTFLLLPWPTFTCFYETHLPTSFNKKTFFDLWEKEEKVLDETSKVKFRSKDGVNQWLFRDWQLAKGEFKPRKLSIGKYYTISNNNLEIISTIKRQKYKMICLNDNANIEDFERTREEIKQTFNYILSEKSSFEI